MRFERYVLAMCALAVVCAGCGGGSRTALVDADAEFERALFLRRQEAHAKSAEAFAQFAARYEHDRRADYAQYLSGEGYRLAGREGAAFEAYDKLFATFRHSAYLSRANDRCIDMGKKLLDGGDASGVRFVEQVTLRSPYGERSARAHMVLGNYHYAASRFAEAKTDYVAVADDHPSSPWKTRAELGAALCEYRQIDRPARNMVHALEARRRLTRLRTAPLTATEMAVVDRYLAEVLNLAAERQMLMARFHLKQGDLEPALAYLKDVIENYRGSSYYDAAVELALTIQKQSRESE